MKPHLISVIIPVYNSEETLRACLDSLRAQTYRALEIICVDDGSTDKTPSVLEERRREDARIRVLTLPHAGAAAARNAGLAEASGDYLSFLDADDLFEPDMYRVMLSQIIKTDADICVCASDSRDAVTGAASYNFRAMREEFLPESEVFSRRDLPERILNVFAGWPWDKLFRAEFIRGEGLLFQELENSNDFFFVDMAIATAERVTFVRDVFIHKLEGRAGSISLSPGKRWDCSFKALVKEKDELEARGLFSLVERSYHNRALGNIIWNLKILSVEGRAAYVDALRSGGFRELGLAGKPPGYFYDRAVYGDFMRVLAGKPPRQRTPQAKRSLAYALKRRFPRLYRLYRKRKYG